MIRVRYNNAYNVIRREFPAEVGEARYATYTITSKSGSSLKTATSADIWGVKSKIAVVTTSAAIAIGDYTATLSLGTETTSLYPGDVLRIGGGTGAVDTLTVQSYDSSTYTVTFTDYFQSAHASGAYVVGRWVAPTLDTTTVATWTSDLEFAVEWAFSLVAGTPLAATRTWTATDEGVVEKRTYTSQGDLEGRFRARFRRYYESIEQGDWVRFETDAFNELRDMFEVRGCNITRLVDSDRLAELQMSQIAMDIAWSQGDDWQSERDYTKVRRNELFERLASLPMWVDTDASLVEEDEEVQTYERPYPRRRLF